MLVTKTCIMKQKPTVRIEKQAAFQKEEYSIQFENGMYRVVVPWPSNGSDVPNNYKIAL